MSVNMIWYFAQINNNNNPYLLNYHNKILLTRSHHVGFQEFLNLN